MKPLPNHLIKICGLTQVSDAIFAIEHGANAVGFIFAPSSRQVTLEQAQQLANATGTALRVGVMKDLTESEILGILDAVKLDAVQLHDTPTPELLREIADRDLLAFAVAHRGDPPAELANGLAALLLDNPSPGSGEMNDFPSFRAWDLPIPLIFAGGLSPVNVGDVIRTFHPYGVDVSSGVESTPGIKDLDKVSAFITTAQRAFEEK
jgi:phosphoribosylanthranilate isomerase